MTPSEIFDKSKNNGIKLSTAKASELTACMYYLIVNISSACMYVSKMEISDRDVAAANVTEE
jgi:hypothetical protein